MATYSELDFLIKQAIEAGRSALYCRRVNAEAVRIAMATGRDAMRVIDGRLQSMRKSGEIRHLTKAESNGQGGWHVIIKGGE